MAITTKCEQCGAELSFPKAFEGQKGRCRQCGHILQIPGATALAIAQQDDAKLADRVSTYMQQGQRSAEQESDNYLSENSSDSSQFNQSTKKPLRLEEKIEQPKPIKNIGLGIFGHLFRIIGVLQWVAAAVLSIVALQQHVGSDSAKNTDSIFANFWIKNDISAFSQTIPAVVFLLLFGFLCLGLGQLFLCVKDISRNSCDSAKGKV